MASPPLLGPLGIRPGWRGWRGMGGFGAGAVGDRAGVGQADLAAGGQGAAGLAGLLGEQAAAFGGLQQPLVRPRGGRGRRWRPGCRGCGSTPTAAGCAGPGGRWRPGPAPWPAPPAHSELLVRGRTGTETTGAGRSAWRCCSSCSERQLGPGQRGIEVPVGDPLVGVAGGVAAGWGDDIATAAPPVHMLEAAGIGRCRGRSGPGSSASRPHRSGPAAPSCSRPWAAGEGADGVGAGGAVDVQDVEGVAGGEADVGLGVAGPPGQDPGSVGGGVLDAVGDQGCPGGACRPGRSPDPDTSSSFLPTGSAAVGRQELGWRSPWWGRG